MPAAGSEGSKLASWMLFLTPSLAVWLVLLPDVLTDEV
jgi:hypothetical protein